MSTYIKAGVGLAPASTKRARGEDCNSHDRGHKRRRLQQDSRTTTLHGFRATAQVRPARAPDLAQTVHKAQEQDDSEQEADPRIEYWMSKLEGTLKPCKVAGCMRSSCPGNFG
jgi:hypothetical protein